MPQSQVATKADLKNLEKRLDAKIDTKTDVLAHAILKLEQRLEDSIAELRTEAKNNMQRVLDHIDAFAGLIKDYSRKALYHDHRFNELEPVVKDHEKRIVLLENQQPDQL